LASSAWKRDSAEVNSAAMDNTIAALMAIVGLFKILIPLLATL
jgi:hypothetical protein